MFTGFSPDAINVYGVRVVSAPADYASDEKERERDQSAGQAAWPEMDQTAGNPDPAWE